MTGHELPEQLKQLMAGYVLGDLSPEEAEELKRLLAENPALRTEVSNLQEILGLIPYALPKVEPPQHLRAAILKAARTSVKRNQKRSALPWGKIIGSVAALLAVAVGLDNYRVRQELSTTQALVARQKDVIAMLQQPKTHLVSLKGMDMASAASGNIVITPGEPKAVLILQNLPVLPEGQFYQLWTVVNNEKIPSGQFNANSLGRVLVKLPIPSNGEMRELVVTVEVSPAPVRPSGPMVMTSKI